MRSLRSKLVEQFLFLYGGKEKFVDEKALAAFMEQKRKDRKPYVLPRKIGERFNLVLRTYDDMSCYFFNFENKPTKKQILYLHGGAYVSQPLIFHWNFLGKLAKETGATIYVPIYPKAPNHQYQESFDKVFLIYEEILGKSGVDNLIFMGDSAGGGFALALAELLLEKGMPQPKHIILLSPWLDITMKNPDLRAFEKLDPLIGIYGAAEMGKSFAGNANPNYYMLSPINGEIKGLGKISVFIGTHEVLLPDIRKFKNMTEAQGVKINYFEYPNMNHVFPVYPIPEAKKARKEIVDIMENG
ncbi:alpha/beta hydrolase [Virgibacillus sp. NKC19-16]|uniref:alpha/beta hydrolase fold domain-containing protein n=1 Tax=Virgibacillus salidurans TaxID=2831673 RepID=UPI001F2CF0CC|nr:alpha/beta hydrolase [Virgibacillus sp. NKC19-16]UJL45299.1 alpha/beta hydrolase [Virgibacillus sp. NKC19-16]